MKNAEEGIALVNSSQKPHAFISTREHLTHLMLINGQNYFYLPPQTEESTFNLDIMAIAMHKEFKYKNQINKLYAFSIFSIRF